MLLLVAVWLIVIGYSSLYVGYNTVTGKTMTFKEALTGTP